MHALKRCACIALGLMWRSFKVSALCLFQGQNSGCIMICVSSEGIVFIRAWVHEQAIGGHYGSD